MPGYQKIACAIGGLATHKKKRGRNVRTDGRAESTESGLQMAGWRSLSKSQRLLARAVLPITPTVVVMIQTRPNIDINQPRLRILF